MPTEPFPPDLQPGDRVRVQIPRAESRRLHALTSVPVPDRIGTVDRLDERLGEHSVVVVFDLRHLGTRWTDRFMPSGLEPA